MKPRTFIIAASLALGILALILFNTPVSATTSGGKTVSCGTAWAPDTTAAVRSHFVDTMTNALEGNYGVANSFDGYQQACADSVSTRNTWGWVLAGLGILGLIGGLAVRRVSLPANRADGQ